MVLNLLSSPPTTFIVGLIVAIISYIVYQRRRYKLPPGPTPFPILGNILHFDVKKHIHEQIAEWSKKYGPVVRFKEGGSTVVVLNRIDVVLEAMVKRQEDFAGRTQYPSLVRFTEGGKDIGFGQYGPIWRQQRRMAAKALRHYMSGPAKLEASIKEPVSLAIEELKKEKKAFDPYFHLSLIIVNIFCGFCFGRTYSLETTEFRRTVDWLDITSESLILGFPEDRWPLLRYWPSKKFRRHFKANAEMLTFLYQHLREHQRTFSRDRIRDLIDFLLLARKETEESTGLRSKITDAHVNQIIADMLLGGVDADRVTLYWAILFMAVHQNVQVKVLQELDDVLDGVNLPSISDRCRMPYTEATLHECMRLGTAVPIGLPHETICDSTVGGYDIPKGTTVRINHWALHHDPDQWKDVETFNPERFLDDTGKMAPKPESFLPFSAGKRACLGETVARPQLHLILAALMRKFKVSLPKGVKADFRPDMLLRGRPMRYKIIMEERK